MVLEHDGALSGTTGAVLDPIFALRSPPAAARTVGLVASRR
jgi:hypothetical protein